MLVVKKSSSVREVMIDCNLTIDSHPDLPPRADAHALMQSNSTVEGESMDNALVYSGHMMVREQLWSGRTCMTELWLCVYV